MRQQWVDQYLQVMLGPTPRASPSSTKYAHKYAIPTNIPPLVEQMPSHVAGRAEDRQRQVSSQRGSGGEERALNKLESQQEGEENENTLARLLMFESGQLGSRDYISAGKVASSQYYTPYDPSSSGGQGSSSKLGSSSAVKYVHSRYQPSGQPDQDSGLPNFYPTFPNLNTLPLFQSEYHQQQQFGHLYPNQQPNRGMQKLELSQSSGRSQEQTARLNTDAQYGVQDDSSQSEDMLCSFIMKLVDIMNRKLRVKFRYSFQAFYLHSKYIPFVPETNPPNHGRGSYTYSHSSQISLNKDREINNAGLSSISSIELEANHNNFAYNIASPNSSSQSQIPLRKHIFAIEDNQGHSGLQNYPWASTKDQVEGAKGRREKGQKNPFSQTHPATHGDNGQWQHGILPTFHKIIEQEQEESNANTNSNIVANGLSSVPQFQFNGNLRAKSKSKRLSAPAAVQGIHTADSKIQTPSINYAPFRPIHQFYTTASRGMEGLNKNFAKSRLQNTFKSDKPIHTQFKLAINQGSKQKMSALLSSDLVAAEPDYSAMNLDQEQLHANSPSSQIAEEEVLHLESNSKNNLAHSESNKHKQAEANQDQPHYINVGKPLAIPPLARPATSYIHSNQAPLQNPSLSSPRTLNSHFAPPAPIHMARVPNSQRPVSNPRPSVHFNLVRSLSPAGTQNPLMVASLPFQQDSSQRKPEPLQQSPVKNHRVFSQNSAPLLKITFDKKEPAIQNRNIFVTFGNDPNSRRPVSQPAPRMLSPGVAPRQPISQARPAEMESRRLETVRAAYYGYDLKVGGQVTINNRVVRQTSPALRSCTSSPNLTKINFVSSSQPPPSPVQVYGARPNTVITILNTPNSPRRPDRPSNICFHNQTPSQYVASRPQSSLTGVHKKMDQTIISGLMGGDSQIRDLFPYQQKDAVIEDYKGLDRQERTHKMDLSPRNLTPAPQLHSNGITANNLHPIYREYHHTDNRPISQGKKLNVFSKQTLGNMNLRSRAP